MKKTVLLVTSALLAISLGAHADIYTTEIQNGVGVLSFSGQGILAGQIEFSSITQGGVGNFTLEMGISLIPTPDLGAGTPYTAFVSFDVVTANVVFSDAILSMMVDPTIADYVTVGSMYRNDGTGWQEYGASVIQPLDGFTVMQATGVSSFSDWGGWGNDPIIPDPSIVSIIGCGLLLLSKKLKS